MANDWIDVSLAEISVRIGDGLHGTPKYCEHGEYPFINGNNLENGSIVVKDATKKVSQDEYLKHKKELTNNTVLVSINGTIGKVALYNGEEVVLGKSACYINLKDGISKHFIRYVLSGYLFQEYIQRCSTGSTIKNVSLKMMRNFRFKMPKTEAEQLAVIQSVKDLDNKITLNRQINQTLEQMAQTLFKSWFVDFDPVMDNALDAGNSIPDEMQHRAEARKTVRESEGFKPLPDDVRQLFPDAFEESELGWVPKGWVVTRLDNILELAYGKALKKTDRVEGPYPVYGSGGVNGTHNNYLVKGPGIIVGRKGTVGSLHWERNHFFPIDTVFYVKPHIGYSLTYCFYLLQTLGLETMNTDAAVPGLNRNNAYRLKCVIPSEKVREHLTKTLTDSRTKMDACLENIETLSKLRDELLPKLISGEIKIGDSF